MSHAPLCKPEWYHCSITATPYCMASLQMPSIVYRECRTVPQDWLRAIIDDLTSLPFSGPCTGCQSSTESCTNWTYWLLNHCIVMALHTSEISFLFTNQLVPCDHPIRIYSLFLNSDSNHLVDVLFLLGLHNYGMNCRWCSEMRQTWVVLNLNWKLFILCELFLKSYSPLFFFSLAVKHIWMFLSTKCAIEM